MIIIKFNKIQIMKKKHENTIKENVIILFEISHGITIKNNKKDDISNKIIENHFIILISSY